MAANEPENSDEKPVTIEERMRLASNIARMYGPPLIKAFEIVRDSEPPEGPDSKPVEEQPDSKGRFLLTMHMSVPRSNDPQSRTGNNTEELVLNFYKLSRATVRKLEQHAIEVFGELLEEEDDSSDECDSNVLDE